MAEANALENPMDRGAWQATIYGVTKSHFIEKNIPVSLASFRFANVLLMKSRLTFSQFYYCFSIVTCITSLSD